VTSGFSVRPGVLESGSGQVTGLQDQCEQVAAVVAAVLDELAGAAGDPGVQAAAEGVARAAARRFLDAAAGYQHTARNLTQAAQGYRRAEAAATSQAHAAGAPLPPVRFR
jgi:hypothetical protein